MKTDYFILIACCVVLGMIFYSGNEGIKDINRLNKNIDSLNYLQDSLEIELEITSVKRDSLSKLLKERVEIEDSLIVLREETRKELDAILGKYDSLLNKPDTLSKLAIQKYEEEH